MFNTVKSIALATGVSIAALSTAAFADNNIMFSEIAVDVSVDAAEDSNAMEMYPEIAQDIKSAVAERLMGSSDAGDPRIVIDIRKVSLNGSMMLGADKAFNEIEGIISIRDGNNVIGNGSTTYPVNVAAYEATQVIPEGYVAIEPSTEQFYEAMIRGFADVVEQTVQDLEPSGTGTAKDK